MTISPEQDVDEVGSRLARDHEEVAKWRVTAGVRMFSPCPFRISYHYERCVNVLDVKCSGAAQSPSSIVPDKSYMRIGQVETNRSFTKVPSEPKA